ncbi:oxidoreductase [Phlyctema vagabunda]|uniref:Oxidoreductase n=1 Tax=Phlyctema vagabunda TaxID=108571 RepID=A0ABR4PUH3_9HELO
MAGVKDFRPSKDIPSLRGKVVFVTRGTAGLGRISVLELAKHDPEHIYFSGRKQEAAETVIQSVKRELPGVQLTFLNLDLSSITSVNTVLQQFHPGRLDILMCNAGIMAVPPGLSADGWEIQFATNHLGHAALIKKLLPVMLKTADAPDSDVRIVLNTSDGWRGHSKEGINFATLNTTQEAFLGHWFRYAQSKIADIIYAQELARRYPSIKTVTIHPGVIVTGLVSSLGFWDRFLIYSTNIGRRSSIEEGSYNQLYLAAGMKREEIINGATYYPVGVLKELDDVAKSEKLRTELWEWTEKALED